MINQINQEKGEIVCNYRMHNETSSTPENITQVAKLYYHNDHLGSTSILTNQSGAVVEQTFYEPFGGIIAGGNFSRYDYEGREFSSLTGDYDFRFRKYDPQLKIFTQGDAGVNNVYDPQELNRYTFEKNNPYKYVDKDGRTPIIAAAAVYTIGEFIIDVVSLTSSYMSYIDDPNSGVNIAALIADVVDIASGPLSNPGPSGIMVHMTDAAWKKTMKHAKQKGVEYLATEGLYGIETGNLFGYSIYNGYFYGNQFSSGTSYRLDQTNQIIDYGNGVSYNSGTGVVCTGELCYSTAFPESYSSGSSGKGRSSDDKDRRDNDYPGDEYCSQYSDRRCG